MDFVIALFYILCGIIILVSVLFLTLAIYLRNFVFRVQTEVPPLKWISYPELEAQFGNLFRLIVLLLRDNKMLVARVSPRLVAESLIFNGTEEENNERVLTIVKELDSELDRNLWAKHLDVCEVMLLARPRRRRRSLFEGLKAFEPSQSRRST